MKSGSFKEREFQYQDVLAQLDCAFALLYMDDSFELSVKWVNEHAKRYLRINNEAMLGKSIVSFLPESLVSLWLEKEEECIRRGVAIEFEAGIYFKERKKEFFFDINMMPIHSSANFLVGMAVMARDITLKKREEQDKLIKEQAFRELIDNSPDVVVRYDRNCRRVYVNNEYEKITGKLLHEVKGKTLVDFSSLDQETAVKLQSLVAKVVESGVAESGIISLSGVDNTSRYYEVRLLPERNINQDVSGVLLLGRDFTKQHEAEAKLKDSELKYRSLINNSPDIICRYDCDAKLIFANTALFSLTGLRKKDVYGLTPKEVRGVVLRRHGYRNFLSSCRVENAVKGVIFRKEVIEIDAKIIKENGEQLLVLMRLVPEFDQDDKLISVLSISRDITMLNGYQRLIHDISNYSLLTGLPNTSSFKRIIAGKIESNVNGFGLIAIDVDGFKHINDSLGRDAGDRVIECLAHRLRDTKLGIVAHLGVDEFGILVEDISSREEMESVIELVKKSVVGNFGGVEVNISASIGVCIWPDDGVETVNILHALDLALHKAKSLGSGEVYFYSNELATVARRRLQLISDLKECVERKELFLLYQPKVDLNSGKILGAEALLRWDHPIQGVLAPDSFIPLAEETGLIQGIGHWVLAEAIRTAVKINAAGSTAFKIAVNLSALQFCNKPSNISDDLANLLYENSCSPEWIEIEITESLLLKDSSYVLDQLGQIREIGVTIAIDDFGTGYSSLSYLTRFPIDTLKIDRSFIRHLLTDEHSWILVEAIVSLSIGLSLNVIAEGVEEHSQAILLKKIGCFQAQGYFFDKPLAYEKLLARVVQERYLL